MMFHYLDLGSDSDWSCHVGNLIQPIRSTTQIWVVTRHQYGISVLISQTSFGRETSCSVAKCRLFPQAIVSVAIVSVVTLMHLVVFMCRPRDIFFSVKIFKN